MKSLCLQILGCCCLLLINPMKCRVIKEGVDSSAPDPTMLTTEVPTTPPSSQEGCFHEGRWYPLDSEISHEKNEEMDWCYGLLCDHSGSLVHWDNFNCYPPTTPTSMAPTTTPMTSPYPHGGCFYEQKWYAQYTDISQGSDGQGWCYGLYCAGYGNVEAWDDFNCGPTTAGSTVPPETTPLPVATTEIPTTTPTEMAPTTTPMTSPPPHGGCFYEHKWYGPDTEISRGSDGHDWCYGLYCTDDGNVMAWDDWNCGPTTAGSTVPPPETTPLPVANTEIPTTRVVTP